MEADWEFEVGGDAPVIEAHWPGFVDLRWTPGRADQLSLLARNLPEAAQFPALAATIEKLNGRYSRVWTSKCDFWPELQPGEFDPDELDASPGSFAHACGCYIDLLPESGQQSPFPQMLQAACKRWCDRMHAVPLRCSRVDLIIRRALIAPDLMDMGVTTYVTACGPDSREAKHTLGSAIGAFADALCPNSTVQWKCMGE